MQGLVSGMRPPGHLPAIIIGVFVLGACTSCDANGFPVCPPGLQSCGAAGCYSSMFTRCVQGQCQSIIASFISGAAATRPCPVKYLNTCGTSYCGVNEGCLEGVCHQTPSINSSQVLNYTLESAAVVTLDMSALEMCSAAKKTLDACADDNSQLQVIECNSIGVGSAAGVTCLQSHLFNCAGGPGFSPFYSCRALSVLGDAVTQAVGNKVENASQPVFENLAQWVGNVSQNVLNITIPSTQSSSNALTTLLAGGKANDSGSADGFKLAPPDGVNGACWSGLSMGLLVSKHCWCASAAAAVAAAAVHLHQLAWAGGTSAIAVQSASRLHQLLPDISSWVNYVTFFNSHSICLKVLGPGAVCCIVKLLQRICISAISSIDTVQPASDSI